MNFRDLWRQKCSTSLDHAVDLMYPGAKMRAGDLGLACGWDDSLKELIFSHEVGIITEEQIREFFMDADFEGLDQLIQTFAPPRESPWINLPKWEEKGENL